VSVLAMVPQPRLNPLGERGQVVAAPLLQGVAGKSVTGASALISQNRHLLHQMWVLRPTHVNPVATSQTYSVTNKSTTASSQHNNCCRCCGVRQVAGSYCRGSNPYSQLPGSDPGCRSRQDQIPDTPTPPAALAPGKAAPTLGLRRSGSPVGPGSAAIPQHRASTTLGRSASWRRPA
jgi:hypothetical protein